MDKKRVNNINIIFFKVDKQRGSEGLPKVDKKILNIININFAIVDKGQRGGGKTIIFFCVDIMPFVLGSLPLRISRNVHIFAQNISESFHSQKHS